MFYHVLIETNEKMPKSGVNKKIYSLDNDQLDSIVTDILVPFLNGEEFQVDGYLLKKSKIERLAVKESSQSTEAISKYRNDNMPRNVIMFITRQDTLGDDERMKDKTKEALEMARTASKITASKIPKPSTLSEHVKKSGTKVFIVHGHDSAAKNEVARFIENLSFQAIILHEQANDGKTIIEKFEKESEVGFAIALYTGCDKGASVNDLTNLKLRPRQNVVFEHGYFIGKLGRGNVCALVKSGVETPSDILGIVYISLDESGGWKIPLAKELRNAGYDVDMNKVIV